MRITHRGIFRWGCGWTFEAFFSGDCLDPFAFHAIIAAGFEILELLDPAVGPVNHGSVDRLLLAYAERDRQLGLRKVASSAAHHAQAGLPCVRDPDRRANRVAIGLGPDQPEPDKAIPAKLIIAVQVRRTVIGC